MEKMKLFAGILLFGSLWGFSECIIGSSLRDANLPAGAIMTGVFAIMFMTMSRMLYRQRGMQLGMGLVAGALRLFNPFGGCFICSAIAIVAEGVIFEIIWYKMSLDLQELKLPKLSISMGITTTYVLYVGGYIITQILTPILSSAGFYLENLLVFIPQILASGLLAAIIGGITVPAVLATKKLGTYQDIILFDHRHAFRICCLFLLF
ncbi:unnamed protein product [marine sediment metagenome]|uniref:Uncharacterized protein n=1 Tax=marine sediment metagenome TaxID=412755 RepID=X1B069_9ZZZZ